jgi:hypothetical protein
MAILPILTLLLTTTFFSHPSSASRSVAIRSNSLNLNQTLQLEPWQITRLSTFSPSLRPGSYPYSYLSLAISNPNTINLGPTIFGDAILPPTNTTCLVWWLDNVEDPRDAAWGVNTCSNSAGGLLTNKWTVQMLHPPPPAGNSSSGSGSSRVTMNFVLRFGLSEAVVLENGGIMELRFEGEAAFKVGRGEEGGNMDGVCGGSGICSWGLKEGLAPVMVKQRLVEKRCRAWDCGL